MLIVSLRSPSFEQSYDEPLLSFLKSADIAPVVNTSDLLFSELNSDPRLILTENIDKSTLVKTLYALNYSYVYNNEVVDQHPNAKANRLIAFAIMVNLVPQGANQPVAPSYYNSKSQKYSSQD